VNWLKKFFHDPAGEPSMMRLMLCLAFGVILGIWVFKNVQAPQGLFIDLAPNAKETLWGVLFGKVLQSGTEHPGGIGGLIGSIKDSFAAKGVKGE
jgi:hypothetical protein